MFLVATDRNHAHTYTHTHGTLGLLTDRTWSRTGLHLPLVTFFKRILLVIPQSANKLRIHFGPHSVIPGWIRFPTWMSSALPSPRGIKTCDNTRENTRMWQLEQIPILHAIDCILIRRRAREHDRITPTWHDRTRAETRIRGGEKIHMTHPAARGAQAGRRGRRRGCWLRNSCAAKTIWLNVIASSRNPIHRVAFSRRVGKTMYICTSILYGYEEDSLECTYTRI